MKISNLFSKKNILYTIIFIVGVLLIVVNRIIVGFNDILWIIDFASFFGVMYVIFIAKHSVLGLVFDLLATLVLIATNAIQHLWLNLAVCALIAVPNLTMGIFRWKKNQKIDDVLNFNKLTKKQTILLLFGYVFISIIFAIILYYLGGNLFYLDAFYSACCAVGLVLSSFAFIDQFYIYMLADVCFGVPMYIMLTIQDINNLTMIFTSLIYIIGNVVGVINWKRLLKQIKTEEQQNNTEIEQKI